MDRNKQMTKLLILGANTETIPLIKTAQNMGFFVIVTDNNPQSPAKKYADSSINIDGIDIDNIVNFCKQEKIDGILVGVADKLVQTYAKVCGILGLPQYIDIEASQILSNKKNFDNYCQSLKIQTIPKINLTNINENILANGILLKPSDGCSGKGINVAYTLEDLKIYYNESMKYSISHDVLIEKCMYGDEIFAYFTIIDNEVYLSAVADKITNKSQGITGKVILNSIYPSKYTQLFYDTQYQKINKLIKSLNINTGIFMISAFVENNEFYLYDPGCRLQGEAPDMVLENIFGIDSKQMLISYALGKLYQKPLHIESSYYFDNICAATVWILGKSGTIDKIVGLDDVKNKFGVYHLLQRLFPGDVITDNMVKTEAQVIARIYTKAKNIEELQNNIRSIRDHIKVISNNNKDLLIHE